MDTALVVPVPELEPTLARAHLVLLAPFVGLADLNAGLLGELRDYCAEVVPFAFTLGEVSDYPGGGHYLAPDPSAPLRALAHDLRREFGESTGGRLDLQHIPAVGVPAGFRLPAPVLAHAVRVELRHGPHTLGEFPFAASVA